MKIGAKIIITAMVSILLGTSLAILIAATVSMQYILREEDAAVQNHLRSAGMILRSERSVLEKNELDWSNWDDTYQFIAHPTSAYIESNLGDSTLEQLKLYSMVFLDKNLHQVYANTVSDKSAPAVMQEVTRSLKKLSHSLDTGTSDVLSGTALIQGKPYILAIAGITTSGGKATPNGYLVMLRQLDPSFFGYTEELLGAKITLSPSDAHPQTLSPDQFALMGTKRDDENLTSLAVMQDVLSGNPIALSLSMERSQYQNAAYTFRILELTIFIILLVTIGGSFIVTNQTVIKKIRNLSQFVDSVIRDNNLSRRAEVSGDDEISQLTGNINDMLSRLSRYFADAQKNDERLRLIMEATSDGYFDYHIPTQAIIVNAPWRKHLGHTDQRDLFYYEELLPYIHPDDKPSFEEALQNYLQQKTDRFEQECRLYKASGGFIWALVRGKIVETDENGAAVRLIGILSDITARKVAEQDRLYLLQTDTVTSLKNRAYLENILAQADEDEHSQYGILMADANGLKLINDAFGHKEGDRLLRVIGCILKKCCSDTDIPVRWGGDEFVIYTQNSLEYTQQLMEKIHLECGLVDSFPIKLSISMGCSEKTDELPRSEAVMRRAEEKMYHNKLLEGRSVRNEIVSCLIRSLKEKGLETQEESCAAKALCLKMGTKLNCPQEELDELELLVLIHDIGKITIPDYILSKQDPLPAEDLQLLEAHAEAGYRIAKTIPEIAHVATKIWCHHEHFDGSGYPRGISGMQIPKISRILSTAEFFVALTHGRSDQAAMRESAALGEIEKHSGTWFDPETVDALFSVIGLAKKI